MASHSVPIPLFSAFLPQSSPCPLSQFLDGRLPSPRLLGLCGLWQSFFKDVCPRPSHHCPSQPPHPQPLCGPSLTHPFPCQGICDLCAGHMPFSSWAC